jgi:hypothetical protein
MPKRTTPVTLQNCEFNAVKWDASALESVHTLACALRQDAIAAAERCVAIRALCDVFKASNVRVETMVRIAEENVK